MRTLIHGLGIETTQVFQYALITRRLRGGVPAGAGKMGG